MATPTPETEYVVLHWTNTDGGVWTQLPEPFQARGADAAIKAAAAKHVHELQAQTGEPSFLYVAVPSRSWNPKRVRPVPAMSYLLEDGAA